MKIHNTLPHLLACLQDWTRLPSEAEFKRRYLDPIEPLLAPMLSDFRNYRGYGLYEQVKDLDWNEYRANAISLDPALLQTRLERQIRGVESLLATKLAGESVLFGSFHMMDGYARFEGGSHRVFLGVDEDHARGTYLDVLMAHELTHVARESRPTVWTGFGLDPKMTHDQLVESMPVIEHLMSEGYSCVVSEILVPGGKPWEYVYQTEESYGLVMARTAEISARIHRELTDPEGYYRNLYPTESYGENVPLFAHYVWSWLWVKRLLRTHGGMDAKNLVGLCSKELMDDARSFIMGSVATEAGASV